MARCDSTSYILPLRERKGVFAISSRSAVKCGAMVRATRTTWTLFRCVGHASGLQNRTGGFIE